MKIIYIANIRIPTEKAHGYQIMKMCEQFSNCGFDVELVLPKRINILTSDLKHYYNVKGNFKITYLQVWDLVRFGKLGWIIEVVSYIISLRKKINFNNDDIYYSRDYYLINFLPKVNRLFVELHSLPTKISKIRNIFKRVNKFIVLTTCLKNELLKLNWSEDKILVSPDGVDLDEISQITGDKNVLRNDLSLPLNKIIFGYIGKLKTMGMSKGVEDLLYKFIDILKRNSDFFLLIVGLNEYEISGLEKFIGSKVGKDQFKLIGHVDRMDVFKYEKAADVLLMTYPSTQHYRCYMSPLKLFEYMASGNLIVSTDLPSIRDVLNEKNAIFIKPDLCDLSDKISKIFKTNNYKEIAQKSYKDANMYSWEERAKKIKNFIN